MIRIEDGGIRPLSRGLWGAATEKLNEAIHALRIMEGAADRLAFESGWTQFVDSLEEFWARFYDEGKLTFTKFQPWAGSIDAQRKAEPLLQYLYQARHQSQHGRIAIDWEDQRYLIAPGFNGIIRRLKIFSDGTFELDATPAAPTVHEAEIVHSPGRARLPIIENKKFRQSYFPPMEFDGCPLPDPGPVEVARKGVEFYISVLNQARAKFDDASQNTERNG